MKKHTVPRASVLAVLFASFLCCCVGLSARQEQKSDVGNVLTNFPGFHLLTSKERDPDTTAFILKRFPKSNPSVVHADFDGDGNLDYALLLKNDKSQAAKLVVLLCSGTSHCRSVYELDVTADSGIVYLRPVATGSVMSQTEAIDSTTAPSPAKLHSTGIQVTYFEKAAVVLYWDRKLKNIREVQTAD
jgi:hypothetical protein